MNAGAFSDEKVIAAVQKIVPVLVDCSEKGQNAELQQRFEIQGYPTVIYADAEGKKIRKMGSREARSIVKDVEDLAAKYPGRPSAWAYSFPKAMELGKKEKKPIALYAYKEGIDLVKILRSVESDLGELKKKFILVPVKGEGEGSKENREKLGIETAPCFIVLDPRQDKPEENPLARIAADKKSVTVKKELEGALKQYQQKE